MRERICVCVGMGGGGGGGGREAASKILYISITEIIKSVPFEIPSSKPGSHKLLVSVKI